MSEKNSEPNSGRTLNEALAQAEAEGNDAIVVDVSEQELRTYRTISAKLNDPVFRSGLTLAAFAQSAELKSLPATLQLFLLSRVAQLEECAPDAALGNVSVN